MRRKNLLAGLLGLAVICGVVVAQDATTQESEKPAARASGGHAVKLVKPWSMIASLTEAQVQKIRDIHQQALDDIRSIRDKEEADITAILTDEQKAELKAAEDRVKAESKAKRAEKKASDGKDKDADSEKDEHGDR